MSLGLLGSCGAYLASSAGMSIFNKLAITALSRPHLRGSPNPRFARAGGSVAGLRLVRAWLGATGARPARLAGNTDRSGRRTRADARSGPSEAAAGAASSSPLPSLARCAHPPGLLPRCIARRGCSRLQTRGAPTSSCQAAAHHARAHPDGLHGLNHGRRVVDGARGLAAGLKWRQTTIVINYYTIPHTSTLLHPRRARSWFKIAPNLSDATAPWLTPAYLESRRAHTQSGALPGLAGGLMRRQQARPNPSSTRRFLRFQPPGSFP